MARYPIAGKANAIQADIALTVGGLGAIVQHKAGKLTALGPMADDQIVILGWKSPDRIVNLWAVRAAGVVDDLLLRQRPESLGSEPHPILGPAPGLR